MTQVPPGKKLPWYKRKTLLKRASISAVVTLVVFFAGGMLVQRVLLPAFIVHTLRPDEKPSALIPNRFLPALYKSRAELNGHIDHLPQMLDSLGMNTHEFVTMLELMEYDHIGDAIRELNATQLTSIDEVYTIIVRNVQVEGYDLEVFRPTFCRRVELHKVERLIKKIDDPLLNSLAAPTIKHTLVRLLHENREEIEIALTEKKQAPL